MYVILDLQPGRASLLAQARRYQSLLELPDVGLALDPEWKLAPGQLPRQRIGSVSIREVNSVIRWLAGLTARYRLPQKLLVLHQFRLSMIRNEHKLDTGHEDLAILIHMDGQGSPGDKQQTWQAITSAPRRGVLRVEELLCQRPSDNEPAADDDQDPAAIHDLVPVIAPKCLPPAAQLRSCALSRAACRVRWSRSGRLGADRAASA
jgi:hypothetical protein